MDKSLTEMQKSFVDNFSQTGNAKQSAIKAGYSEATAEQQGHNLKKQLSFEIDEATINNHLYTRDLPDVDLLIRTSGELRISNFLLWQIAYAELYFTDTLWPDYRKDHLFEAIINYQKRERRFGKTSEQLEP